MKRAHDGSVSCVLFRKLVMDFVDDELPEGVRSAVLSHADACPECRAELRKIEQLRKVLTGFPTATVSPEFDFRLKASLRLEESRLRSPFYRIKLFLGENLVPVVGIPAVAALLVTGVAYYRPLFPETAPTVASRPAAPAPEHEKFFVADRPHGTTNVNYVLESLHVSDTGIEVTSNGNPGASVAQPELKAVSQINF